MAGLAPSRKFVEADLRNLRKNDLVAIIKGQINALSGPINPSKLKVAELRFLLLDEDSPFRTDSLLPSDENVSNATAVDEPTESQAPSEDQSLPQTAEKDAPEEPIHLNIRLYVEDFRFSGSIQHRTVKDIKLEATQHPGDKGSIYVIMSWKNLLKELQEGPGAICGFDPVKVGFKDSASPEFVEFFVEAEPLNLHLVEPHPANFGLPFDSELKVKLVVDYANRQPIPIEQMPQSSSSQIPADHNTIGSPRQDLIEWLGTQASNRNHYDTFIASRHRALQNSEAANYWKFIAQFSDHYFRKTHHFSLKNRKILKSDLYTSLGIKATSLSDAEEGTRILSIFGPGGSHPAPYIIAELSKVNTPPHGSAKFLETLKSYDREHSMTI